MAYTWRMGAAGDTSSAFVTRAQSTAEALRQMILSGEIKRGERLRAQMLADRLGVSRTPVNDALAALHKEGLLEYGAHRGYAVKRFDADHLLGAVDVRLTLEGLACRLIAERGIGGSTSHALQENLQHTERVLFGQRWGSEEKEQWRLANLQFHDLLLAEAGNSYLTDGVLRARLLPPLIGYAEKRVDPDTLFPRLDQDFGRQAFRDHTRIVEAIEARQSSRAENMMKEHIFTTREATRRILNEILAD